MTPSFTGRVEAVRFERSGPLPLNRPRKAGDVGYDLPILVDRERQNLVDRLVSWWLRRRRGWTPDKADETHAYVIWPGQTRSFPSGIKIALPGGLWAKMEARSSARNRRLDVCGGRVIDTGYRGLLFSVIHNFGWLPRLVLEGDRLAQLVFYDAVLPPIYEVDSFDHLPPTERGGAGFGSTGR